MMSRLVGWASARARARRAQGLLDLIATIHDGVGRCRIVDLGGELAYWRAIGLERLRGLGVELTLVNPHQPASAAESLEAGLALCYVDADACVLDQFDDLSFDLAHSNSAIEHVGGWERMKAFAGQLRRLAPAYYVQTPYAWFPLEPHFMALGFHWLPERARARRLMRRRHGHHDRAATMDEALEVVRSVRLLDRRQLERLFPDARIDAERVGGLTKSLIGIRQVAG